MKKSLVFVFLILLPFLCSSSAWAVDGGGPDCGSAVVVTPGDHSVSGPDSGNGASGCAVSMEGGTHSEWFSYTATADGLLEIDNCGTGVDSVLFIHTTGCGSEDCAYGGDGDGCDIDSDDNEEYTALGVTNGTTYLIEWSDGQDVDGFDWTLSFSAGVIPGGPGGETCATAVAVTPGLQIAAGPKSGGGASDCSGDTDSEWFSYTPTEDGVITVDSCDSGVDTALYIHTSPCGSEDCAEGGDLDGCPGDYYAERITNFPVIAGNTYLIEWTDNESSSGFPWTLAFNRPVSIPTMGEWGMIIMSLMFLASGIIIMQRRQEQ